MLPFKKILSPTDFSEASYAGLAAANEMALHFSAELLVVNVVAAVPMPIMNSGEGLGGFDVATYQLELESSAKNSLQELLDERVSSELRVRPFVVYGDAANEIVRIAETEQTDLIVIATHGMTGWRRFIFGSVAEKVVRHAPCPVMTVRAPSAEKETK
jgi:nucleotide-binding universal stress UspA family protein